VQIAQNPAVRDGASLRAFFFDKSTTSTRWDYNTRIYRPLRNLAFRGVAKATGRPRPLAFGVVNLVLYAASSLLVLWLALMLTGSLFAATASALLWTLLPVHVEPVAYASGLGDQLSAILQLGSIVAAWKLIRGAPRPVALAAISLLLQAGAMFTKEMAVTTVGILALAVLLEGNRAWRAPRNLALLGAHLVLALVYLAVRTHVVGRVGQDDVTASTVLRGLSEAPGLLLGYLRISVAPLGHRVAYVVPTPSLLRALVTLLTLVAAATLAWWADRRWQIRHGLLFGLGWFALALFPVLHVVPLWADLADRFVLVPSVGLALALAAALAATRSGPRARWVPVVLATVGLLYLAGTFVEARYWQSDGDLWSHAVAEEPSSGLAHANLASPLLAAGQFEASLRQIETAESLGWSDPHVDVVRSQVLEGLGRLPEARMSAHKAVRRDPKLGFAWAQLGDIERRMGRFDAAQAHLAEAQRRDPHDPLTLLLAGAVREQEGRFDEAAAAYDEMLGENPHEARFAMLTARELLAGGHFDAARERARLCRRLAGAAGHPQCACLEGRADLSAGDLQAARAPLDAAVAGLPDGPEKALCVRARAAAGP
jgi:tetratricopeptide (TPR) repeat protein